MLQPLKQLYFMTLLHWINASLALLSLIFLLVCLFICGEHYVIYLFILGGVGVFECLFMRLMSNICTHLSEWIVSGLASGQ